MHSPSRAYPFTPTPSKRRAVYRLSSPLHLSRQTFLLILAPFSLASSSSSFRCYTSPCLAQKAAVSSLPLAKRPSTRLSSLPHCPLSLSSLSFPVGRISFRYQVPLPSQPLANKVSSSAPLVRSSRARERNEPGAGCPSLWLVATPLLASRRDSRLKRCTVTCRSSSIRQSARSSRRSLLDSLLLPHLSVDVLERVSRHLGALLVDPALVSEQDDPAAPSGEGSRRNANRKEVEGVGRVGETREEEDRDPEGWGAVRCRVGRGGDVTGRAD